MGNNTIFWKRFLAFIIDSIIISFVCALIAVPFLDSSKVNKLTDDTKSIIEDYTNSPTINYLSSLPLEKKYLEEQENRDRLLDPSIPYNIRLLYGLPLKESEYRNLIIMANHNKRELEKSINRYTKHYVLLPSFNIKRVK